MSSLQSSINELRTQLEKGLIQQAYRGLMDYMLELRNTFNKKYPDYGIPTSLYHGFLDMTYFPMFPEALKARKLKIAIVFNFDDFRFEVWLSGMNRQVLAEYWKLFTDSGWNTYRIIPQGPGVDSVLEHVLVTGPNFDDLEGLTNKIDQGTQKFIRDIEAFLSTR